MIYLSIFLFSIHLAATQTSSPCPDVLKYDENATESNKRHGVIQLKSSEDLDGIWVHIILNRQAEQLGNWFGKVSSTNNVEFIVQNINYKLKADVQVPIRFFIKYDSTEPIPNIKTIRLNGRTICESPENEEKFSTPIQFPLLCTLSQEALLETPTSQIPLLCKLSDG